MLVPRCARHAQPHPPASQGRAGYATATLIQKTAAILGDSATPTAAASTVAIALTNFQARYSGGYVTSQAGLVLGLVFGLIPQASIATAVASLVSSLNSKGPLVGFVGLRYLFDALANNGQLALAYSIALRTANPSWGYGIATDQMTAVGEVWDPRGNQNLSVASQDANSYNHPLRGCLVEWLMRDVAGIDVDPVTPGWANAILRPRPGGGLTWASGAHRSPRGLFESKWTIAGAKMAWHVVIPANATATLSLPPGYGTAKLAGQPVAALPGVSPMSADPITGGTRYSIPSGTFDLTLTA